MDQVFIESLQIKNVKSLLFLKLGSCKMHFNVSSFSSHAMTGPDTSTFLSPTTGKSPVHATSLIRRLCFVNLENDPETLAFIEEIKVSCVRKLDSIS